MSHSIVPAQSKKRVKRCAVCKKRPGAAVVLGKLVCPQCYHDNVDPDVRLYRLSFQVVKGGLPG